MAVRRPLILNTPDPANGTHIYELTNAQIQYIINNTADDVYRNFPATTLSVVGSGGNLLTSYNNLPMVDIRYQAGTFVTRIDRFATEAETPNISIVTVNYNRINQTTYSGGIPADTNNLRWPVYLDGSGNIRAMTSTDFYDTFVVPALARLAPRPVGDYTISTATSLAGHTLISSTPVYTDTRANQSAYTAGGIPEAQDQPITINNYYLHRNTGTDILDDDANILPLYINAGNEQLYEYTVAQWRNTLGPWLQYYKSQPGATTTYSISDAFNNPIQGTTMGTAMTDTRLLPTGTGYTQRFVNDDDYRTQEFPNGSEFFNLFVKVYELKKNIV